MSRFRFSISMSLDGHVAAPNPIVNDPLGEGSDRLHEWAYPLAAFRMPHGEERGHVNASSAILVEMFQHVGAVMVGRGMLPGGSGTWNNQSKGWRGAPRFTCPCSC